MIELISKQAAINTTFNMCCQWDGEDRDDLRNMMLTAFQELPTIDPVKHGKWLPHPIEKDWDICSVCGIGTHRRFHYNDGVYGGYDVEESFAYCPRCGAKMERSEDETY